MDSSASPKSAGPPQNEEEEDRPKSHKIFVTNLDVEIPSSKLETKLREKFENYGNLDSVVVKKSYNNEYSFAFIEYKEGEDATQAVNELNNSYLEGKKMKVELQDNARRRKGGNETCFNCGKVGHYSRNCRSNKRRSPSYDYDRHRQKRSHHRSRRDRSPSESSDSRRHRKDRKDKKVKKHKSKHDRHEKSSKHHRRRYSSDSRSS